MDAVIVVDQMPGTDQPDQEGEPHDRIVAELRLLLDSLAQRAEEYLRSRAGTEGEETAAHSCGWCPLCTAVAALRAQWPDRKIAEQLVTVVTLLRQLLIEPQDEPSQPDPPEQDIKVQRIAVRRVGGRVLHGQATTTEGRGC